jgi:hypothetical protein
MAPRGRPYRYQEGEKRPVSISLRVPADIYDRLTQYASMHRQSITELVLEGIEWRLETPADPRVQLASDKSNADVLQQLEALIDAKLDAKIEAVLAKRHLEVAVPTPHRQPSTDDIQYYNRNTVIQALSREGALAPQDGLQPCETPVGHEAVSDPVPTPASDIPLFNTTTSYLGKLCPNGHDYAGTGQSLRNRKGNYCVACNKEKIQAKRQPQPA